MFDPVPPNELIELILEQLSRTEYSTEHDSELPLAFTVLALSRELLGTDGKGAQQQVQSALDFLASQGRVMARPAGRSGQLLYKLLIEGDTNHAPVADYVHKTPRPYRTLGHQLQRSGR